MLCVVSLGLSDGRQTNTEADRCLLHCSRILVRRFRGTLHVDAETIDRHSPAVCDCNNRYNCIVSRTGSAAAMRRDSFVDSGLI